MKKILLKYLNLFVLSGLLLVGFAGCSDDKDNDPVNPGPDVEELNFIFLIKMWVKVKQRKLLRLVIR